MKSVKYTATAVRERQEEEAMAGKLYLCATPIGNLEDITLRVIRTLKEADLIAAEDTRNSIKLLNHFDIHTPMTSYHEYNKLQKGRELVTKMLQGQNVALITDAGSPGISDPGEELVAMACEAGVEVTVLPGPAACVTALTLSGLSTRRFAFEAFLPSEKKERQAVLEELEQETRTVVLYEAPHRLCRTLEELKECLGGQRRVAVCRELTKRHETVLRTTLEEACVHYRTEEPPRRVCSGAGREIKTGEERRRTEELEGNAGGGAYGALSEAGHGPEGSHEAGGKRQGMCEKRDLSVSGGEKNKIIMTFLALCNLNLKV